MWLKAVISLRKVLHHRYVTGFWMRLCSGLSLSWTREKFGIEGIRCRESQMYVLHIFIAIDYIRLLPAKLSGVILPWHLVYQVEQQEIYTWPANHLPHLYTQILDIWMHSSTQFKLYRLKKHKTSDKHHSLPILA